MRYWQDKRDARAAKLRAKGRRPEKDLLNAWRSGMQMHEARTGEMVADEMHWVMTEARPVRGPAQEGTYKGRYSKVMPP